MSSLFQTLAKNPSDNHGMGCLYCLHRQILVG